jgi:hypothetical protein
MNLHLFIFLLTVKLGTSIPDGFLFVLLFLMIVNQKRLVTKVIQSAHVQISVFTALRSRDHHKSTIPCHAEDVKESNCHFRPKVKLSTLKHERDYEINVIFPFSVKTHFPFSVIKMLDLMFERFLS